MPLRVKFQYLSDLQACYVHFPQALHNRGTDFRVYKNTFDATGGNVFRAEDTEPLRILINALMANDSGVSLIEAEPYCLRLVVSRAVSHADLEDRVLAACRRAGKIPVKV